MGGPPPLNHGPNVFDGATVFGAMGVAWIGAAAYAVLGILGLVVLMIPGPASAQPASSFAGVSGSAVERVRYSALHDPPRHKGVAPRPPREPEADAPAWRRRIRPVSRRCTTREPPTTVNI
jgi:hypothetical protein